MDLNDAADLFMTASMHGCRFEVHKKGMAVYHVSHSNVQPRPDTPDFGAQAMLPALRRADTVRGKGKRVLKHGKDTYYADAERLIGSAKHRMMTWGVGPDDVLEAEPQRYKANVLGDRSITGHWTFYYQLWGWVKMRLHERVKTKKWLKFKSEYVETTHDAYLKVVFLVQQIYPSKIDLYRLHKTKDD
jgi:hypothetical protein